VSASSSPLFAKRIVDFNEPVVLLGEEPDDHATLTGIFVWLGIIVLDVDHLLELPFDGIEGIVERGGVILLRFAPPSLVLADHQLPARDVHLNGHGDRDLCSLRFAMRHLDDDPTADYAGMTCLQVIDALLNERVESWRGTHALEGDLQGTLHVWKHPSQLSLATSGANLRSGPAFGAIDRGLINAQAAAGRE
jgi:hypothetical protein